MGKSQVLARYEVKTTEIGRICIKKKSGHYSRGSPFKVREGEKKKRDKYGNFPNLILPSLHPVKYRHTLIHTHTEEKQKKKQLGPIAQTAIGYHNAIFIDI